MELRNYQKDLALKGAEILKQNHIVYYALEMRVGKTLISLTTANIIGAKRVLFITKKKAISSIVDDYNSFKFDFSINVINYEQAAKQEAVYDLIIVDEAHSLGAYPKVSLRTKLIKDLVNSNYLILLSGTPSPEGYSQLFHQLWISDHSPFKAYKNFYKWAKDFVDIKERMFGGLRVNDYSRANKEKIWSIVKPLFLMYTQKDAGFNQTVTEEIKYIRMQPKTYELVNDLLKDKMLSNSIVADTPAKLQQKVHQLFSGTIKTDTGDRYIFDKSKIEFIKKNYAGKKLAIFYKYIAEGRMLKEAFPTTDDPEYFNSSNDYMFISQIQSGAMGVNLSSADIIIFLNIDFSSKNYWQARARMQSKDRTKPCIVHWLFAIDGIEEKIYDAVLKKKDYTTFFFQNDFKASLRRAV